MFLERENTRRSRNDVNELPNPMTSEVGETE